MKTQVHVDTASLNKLITKVGGNPFNLVYKFGQTHRGLREIRLVNAQIPVGYYSIRSPYNTININGVVYTIPVGNYSSDSLISVINNIVTPEIGVFSVYPIINKICFIPQSGTATIYTTLPNSNYPVTTSGYYTTTYTSSNLSTPSTVSRNNYSGVTYPDIGSLLGFTNGQSGVSITATNSYILNFDTYINIYISNLGTSSGETDLCSFKIPVNVPYGSVIHWNENSQNFQTVKVSDSSCIVDRLNIQVFDRYGNPLDNNGLDWSFSLEIDSCT